LFFVCFNRDCLHNRCRRVLVNTIWQLWRNGPYAYRICWDYVSYVCVWPWKVHNCKEDRHNPLQKIGFLLVCFKDIEEMTGVRPGWYWQITWRFVAPSLLAIIVVASIIFQFQATPTYSAWNKEEVLWKVNCVNFML